MRTVIIYICLLIIHVNLYSQNLYHKIKAGIDIPGHRIEVVDERNITPRSFYLTSEAGISYDNIVVRGDPVETTEEGDALLGPMIAVGGAGAVIIVAALVIWKRRQPG